MALHFKTYATGLNALPLGCQQANLYTSSGILQTVSSNGIIAMTDRVVISILISVPVLHIVLPVLHIERINKLNARG